MQLDLRKAPWQILSKKLVQVKHIQFVIDELNHDTTLKYNEKKRYLLESYIIYIVSLWEGFIENCFEDVINQLPENKTKVNDLEALKKFNTPSASNIRQLASKCFPDMQDVPNSWGWNKFSNSQALTYLDKLLKARHNVVHAGTGIRVLSRDLNFSYMKLICNIAVQTQNLMSTYLNSKGLMGYEIFELPYPDLQRKDFIIQ